MKIKISEIKIKKRIREDIGDLSGLQASIMKVGLIHPIIISSQKELIAGERRYLACKNLGYAEIEAIVVDESSQLKLLELETHENIYRKDFTPDEITSIAKRKLEILHPSLFYKIFYAIINLFKNIFKFIFRTK
jgi:ParB family transcriptional regulator, chromosome partitioning protein